MKPEFTSEEIIFIEKVMDNQAEIKMMIHRVHCRNLMEKKTDAILKSIRDKFEEARK